MSSLDLPFLVDTPGFNNYAVSTRPSCRLCFFHMRSIARPTTFWIQASPNSINRVPRRRSSKPGFGWDIGPILHQRGRCFGETLGQLYTFGGEGWPRKKDFKEKNKVAGFSPVKQYRDGKGRRRFHGTSALTQTQNLGSMIQIADESGSTMFFNMFNICIHCIWYSKMHLYYIIIYIYSLKTIIYVIFIDDQRDLSWGVPGKNHG